jgi:hypothetical protein
MRGKSAKNDQLGYRLRLAGRTGALGAAAVVAIMALSAVASAGVATPSAFLGAVWAPNTYKSTSACATAAVTAPHWAKLTGAGKLSAAAKASTCSKAKGGTAFASYADANGEIQVHAPVKIPTGVGGVNVTWAIVATGSDTATYTAGVCPVSYSGSYHYNYGYTWFNYSYSYSYCSVEASVSLYGYAWVYDMTTGASSYPSNYWSMYNSSGIYNDTYHYQGNYSNSSYWTSNYSYSGAYSYNYGAGGAQSWVASPTWFVNGTFTHSHKYLVETYISLSCYSTAQGYTGTASCAMNAASGVNHVDLKPFSVW